MKMSDSIDIERVVAETHRVMNRMSVSELSEIHANFDPTSYRMFVAEALTEKVIQLERFVLAQKTAVTETERVAASWWDHFKREYWNRWWMPRWATAPRLRTIVVTRNYYNVCPHLKADPQNKHVEFMMQRRPDA